MENAHRFDRPWVRQVGHGVWGGLLLLSLVFWKERAFFMDAGFQLFNLINEGTIQVYHYRFVTVVPQLLPWLLLQLGASLQVLGLAYSTSYILFYALAWWILAVRLGNERMGWVLIALFTFISLDTFYHIQSEFYLGLTLLLISFGLVLHRPELSGQKWWALQGALLLTVAFSHKLVVIFFLFCWLFFLLDRPALGHWRYLAFLAMMFVFVVVKTVGFTNWYEAAKQAEFQYNLQQFFPHFERLPSNAILLERLVRHYYLLPILMVVVTAWYLWQQSFVKILLVWSFTLGYLLLYNIADPQSMYRFYSEVSYLPAILFVVVPFFFDVVPTWENIKRMGFHSPLGRFLLIGVVASRLGVIADGHRPFSSQFSWIEEKLSACHRLQTNRLLMYSQEVPADTVIMEWGVPFTAMHLSALDHPDSARTLLVLPDFDRYRKELQADTFFLSPFRPFPVSWLDAHYYNLGRGYYKFLSAEGQ